MYYHNFDKCKNNEIQCIETFNKNMFDVYNTIEKAYLLLGDYISEKIRDIEIDDFFCFKKRNNINVNNINNVNNVNNINNRDHPITIINMEGIIIDDDTYIEENGLLSHCSDNIGSSGSESDNGFENTWDIL